MVAPPKIKQTVTPSLHLVPRAASQLHMPPPYYKSAPSSSLPERVTTTTQCWVPSAPRRQFKCHELVPCPPRITLAGILQERKRAPVPIRHCEKIDQNREHLVNSLASISKQPRHFCGKRAKNKRKLQFPVPVGRPAKLIEEGKLSPSIMNVAGDRWYFKQHNNNE